MNFPKANDPILDYTRYSKVGRPKKSDYTTMKDIYREGGTLTVNLPKNTIIKKGLPKINPKHYEH